MTAVGDRVRLLAMPGDPYPIPAGSEGTVTYVNDDTGQVGVAWDDGRRLGLIIGVDSWDMVVP